jgi:uroporphyrinogen-III synthase
MRRVVVLRPEPGASDTVRKLAERGLGAIALPLFAIEPIEWRAPDPAEFDALLLTSANAVRHGAGELAKLRGLPVYAVGEATAEVAREAGLGVAQTGSVGVDALLAQIPPDLRLLHLAGEHRAEPKDARHRITVVTVYRAKALPPAPGLQQAQGNVVLIHSPRAGRRFAELADEANLDRSSITIAAISASAADAAGTGWAEVQTADPPSDDSLLALAERLCHKPEGE